MKTILTNCPKVTRVLWGLALMLLSVSGCSKKNDTTSANPYGGNKGQTTFWASNANTSLYPITVTVNGATIGEIGGPLATAPDCENAVNEVVKFDNQPGTYNFTCTASGNAGNWTGTFTINTGGCYLAQLQ